MNDLKNDTIQTVSLAVTGMTCIKCADSIERLLSSQKGVEIASVNYLLKVANVKFDSENIQLPTIKKLVQSIGYDIDIQESKVNKID